MMKTTLTLALLALVLGALSFQPGEARADHEYRLWLENKRLEKRLERQVEELTWEARSIQAGNRNLRDALDQAGDELAGAASDLKHLQDTLNDLGGRFAPRTKGGAASEPVIEELKDAMQATQESYEETLAKIQRASRAPK